MNHSMEKLALTFPGLREASGLDPWDAYKFDLWADGAQVPHSARYAAQFILMIWNPEREWDTGGFEAIEALRCWDAEHRCAFLQWAAEPWWP